MYAHELITSPVKVSTKWRFVSQFLAYVLVMIDFLADTLYFMWVGFGLTWKLGIAIQGGCMNIKEEIREDVAVLKVTGALMSGPEVSPFQDHIKKLVRMG